MANFNLLLAQPVFQPAQIAWGRYLDDPLPGFNWAHEDLGDRIYYHKQNIYVVGRTKSDTNYSAGCSGVNPSGTGDAFVASYNTICHTYNWIRYFGSATSLDYAYCAAIDPVGDSGWIYIAGEVNETGPKSNLPLAYSCTTTGCSSIFQTKPGDKKDAFIAKFNLKTGKLVRWTYLGGKGMDQILSLDVDTVTHNVYFAGYSESTAFITYSNYGFTPYKGEFTGLGKAIFGGFDSCLNTLKYFSYYGGNGNDRAHDLQILYANNTRYLVISGTTQSHSGIVPVNGNYWDNTFGGGKRDQKNPDAFLLIWNVNTLSSAPDWSSYVGGSNIDRGRGIDITDNNDIYLVSQTLCTPDTNGSKFIPTTDAYMPLGSTRYNSWLAKFHIDSFNAPMGVHLSLLTFMGGGKDDFVKSVRAFHTNDSSDGRDTVVVAGLTYSNDFASADTNAYFLSGPINGNNKEKKRDAFIAVFTKDPLNPSAQQKQSSFTYLGGEKDETDIKADSTLVQKSYNPGIALGPNGSVFIVYSTLGIKSKINGNIPVEYSAYHCPNGTCDSGPKAQPDAYFAQVYPFPQNFIPPVCIPGQYSKEGLLSSNDVSFYPVPFSGITTLSIASNREERAEIYIYDIYGKIILQEKVALHPGDNRISFDLSEQPSGMFISRIVRNDVKDNFVKITKE
ncbi:MAG: T9SS type A sorting domain-containing protein [Chitinophagales bacterium]